VLQNDAEIARDRAKEDLVSLEKTIYADRRARDIELQNVRREADEKRQQQELFQKRIVCLSFLLSVLQFPNRDATGKHFVLFTQRGSVAKNVGCVHRYLFLFVCGFVNTITYERVNTG